MISLESLIKRSISLGVTIKESPSVPKASVTVGIPIATTGTPNVLSLNSFLEFLTPEPGEIPVFES